MSHLNSYDTCLALAKKKKKAACGTVKRVNIFNFNMFYLLCEDYSLSEMEKSLGHVSALGFFRQMA